jgi:NAD(P)-dependent dehydrogenase (short-subunit alcohol dehydrogenase family)
MIDEVKQHYGALHVLVNNAGIAPKQRDDILVATEESFDDVVSINLKGTYFLMQSAANWMIEQSKDETFTGCIINISSMSAAVVSVTVGIFISKAGLSMALNCCKTGRFNIPVFGKAGYNTTDMTAGVKEKYDKLINESYVCKTMGGTGRCGKSCGIACER